MKHHGSLRPESHWAAGILQPSGRPLRVDSKAAPIRATSVRQPLQEVHVFVVRRVWETKPGEARKAASLVAAMGDEYESVEKRSPSRVYFNTSTVPGERNRVYMEWTEEVIASAYRSDIVTSPVRAQELYVRLDELTLDSWIEFFELMTPEKMTDVD